MVTGRYLRCEEAEITFGTVRVCAMYAAVSYAAVSYYYANSNYYQSRVTLRVMEVLNASTVVAVPETGCSQLANGEQMAGNVALISKGNCSFSEQVRNAQAAGAVAVIIANTPGSYNDVDFSGVTVPAMAVTPYAAAKLRENSGRACAIRIGTRSV
jgi:hypothetical protein